MHLHIILPRAPDNNVCTRVLQLSENIDIIKLIRDNDTFQALDYEKKCEVVQAILYCEARYLGLCEVNLQSFQSMPKHLHW